MCSLAKSSGRSWRRGPAIFAVLLATVSTNFAQTNDPAITSQPQGGTTALGEDWGFDVEMSGTAPFIYQWFEDGFAIPDATNSILMIPVVTNFHAGTYTVTVVNPVGRVDSEPAILTISDTPPRRIRNGNITDAGPVRVPMMFSGNGRESGVSFSLQYDTNVLTNPGWEDIGATNSMGGTNDWFLDLSETGQGRVGFRLLSIDQFPATNILLGSFTFDYSLTNDRFRAMLQLTNMPTAFESRSTNNVSLGLLGGIIPQIDLVDVTPLLDLQSGLMEQRLVISYAGTLVITNVDIAVNSLGFDSLSNAVVLYNSIGFTNVDTTFYGDRLELPFASAGEFGPATQRLLTMEYYVSDRITAPVPEYFLRLGQEKIFNVPLAATPLNITTNRYVNGTFVIQFSTVANFVYFVQYAESVEDLINFGPSSRVVDPPVTGNGHSMQWIDNGPPKTESQPIDGTRFYRVIELPVN